MQISPYRIDLLQILIIVSFFTLMFIACFWVVEPFILGFAWASMAVIATWPVLLWLERLFGGRRGPAVAVMTLLLILLLLIPVGMLINSVLDNGVTIINWFNTQRLSLPQLDGLKHIPLVGERLYNGWQNMLHNGAPALLSKIQPYLGKTASWFFNQAIHVGRFLLHCGLMLLFSALLYYRGEAFARSVRHLAFRIGAERGDAATLLAAQAIRAVALGVVVTALVQSTLGGIGLALAGVPYTMLLSMAMFILCVAQLGPLLVLVPAVVWLYFDDNLLWTIILAIWSGLIATLDSVLRPFLIRMGADLPLLLILCGVIGGLLAFGLIGLFIGPVVLAVSYRLILVWVHEVPVPDLDTEEVIKELNESDSQ